MTAREELDQRFRCCQADEDIRVEGAADPGFGRPFLNIPRRRSIHRGYRDLGLLHGLDDGGERLPDLAGKAKSWKSLAGRHGPSG